MSLLLKICCLLWLLCFEKATAAPINEKITGVEYIYIERGNALYSQAGHSLLRIKKEVKNSKGHTIQKDFAYNWGVFNSRSSNFAWEFYKGTLGYKLQVTTTKRYLDFLKASRERGIHSYPLRLSPIEIERLQLGLEKSKKDDTKFYDYHVWYNNCATKIRDLLDQATNGRFKTILQSKSTFKSYRDYWFDTFGNYASVAIGTAILFNKQADHSLTYWEGAFLPEVLRDGISLYSKTLIDEGSETAPFMGPVNTLQEAGNPISALLDGRIAALVLLLALVVFCGLGLRKVTTVNPQKPLSRSYRIAFISPACIFLILCGTVGSLSLINPYLTTREYFYLGSILAFFWPTDFLYLLPLYRLSTMGGHNKKSLKVLHIGMKYAFIKWVMVPISIVYGIVSGYSGLIMNGLVFGLPCFAFYTYSWFLLRNIVQKHEENLAPSLSKTKDKKAA